MPKTPFCPLGAYKIYAETFNAEDKEKILNYVAFLLKKNCPPIFDMNDFCEQAGCEKKYTRYLYSKLKPQDTAFGYYNYHIPKKSGKMRSISEPYEELKYIQTWIKDNILEKNELRKMAKAFVKGISIKDNANIHKGQKYILGLDIKDFFPSITQFDVYLIFRRMGYSKMVSGILSHFCSYKGHLPQGAPTSPYLSNLFMHSFDIRMLGYARKHNLRYTRYADDITFSGTIRNKDNIISFVEYVLKDYRLILNKAKTRLLSRGRSQTVTGITVNQNLSAPRHKRRKIRQEIYYIKKSGLEQHLKNVKITKGNYLGHLLGKIDFVLMINKNDQEFIKYRKYIINLIRERTGKNPKN